MKKIFLLVLLCVFCTASFSQKLKWTVYNQNKKITYTENACPADYPKQDEDANYYCFKNYTVKELDFAIQVDNVFQIVQSKASDSLWFASAEDGVAAFANLRWKNFTSSNSILPLNRITRVFQKDGFGVLAGSPYGVYYLGPNTTINANLPAEMEGISGVSIVDRNNTIWCGYTAGGGLWKTNGTDYTQWINITNENSILPFEADQATVSFLYEQRKNGHIWANVNGYGVYEYDGTGWIDHASEVSEFKTSDYVNPPYEDAAGNIYCGTKAGLYVYNGIQWTLYNTANTSFRSNVVKKVFEDSRKNLWVITEKDISVYDGNGWFSHNMESVLGSVNPYRDLFVEDDFGNIWVAARTGLLMYDGYKWTKFTTSNSPLPHNRVISVFKDRSNNIWVGSEQGLSCIQYDGPATRIPYAISGYTFLDKSSDDMYDKATEPALANRKLILLPDNIYAYSNSLGYYQFHVSQAGTYTVRAVDDAAFIGTKDITFTITDGLNVQADVPYKIGALKSDTLAITVIGGFPRCNNVVTYWLDIKNQGSADFTGTLAFNIDPKTEYSSSNLQPTDVDGKKIVWSNQSIPGLTSKQIQVSVVLPGVEVATDVIDFSADATNLLSEKVFTSALGQKILCAFDPNDKSVLPDNEELLQTDEMEYQIRFQNTGNDTAFTIVIRDTLSPVFDKESFAVLSASHLYTVTLDVLTGEIIFTFNNIQLPDSNVNKKESNGFIRYKVRLKNNLELLTEIKNTAYIYFDRNPSIVTNTTHQVLVNELTTGITANGKEVSGNAYPNPAKDVINMQDREGRLVLYNAIGKNMLEGAADVPLNVSTLPSGMYILYQIKGDATLVHKVEIIH